MNLTKRKRQIISLLADGLTNREIADELSLSVNTIKRHISDMKNQCGALNSTNLVVKVLEMEKKEG